MDLREARQMGTKTLRRHRCRGADAAREAELFLLTATSLPYERMLADDAIEIGPKALVSYRRMLAARLGHRPVEYITGRAQFRRLTLSVTPATLIPRPATEALVEAALPACRAPGALVVDVGTGTGAIALAVADEAPDARILAGDISPAALAVARSNAKRLNLADLVTFRRGDLITPFLPALRRARGPVVIIANLPYIPARMFPRLSREIRANEPHSALVSGPDGLAHYRRLIKQVGTVPDAKRRGLSPFAGKHPGDTARPMYFFLECLPGQYRGLAKMIRAAWPDADISPVKNFSGITIGARTKIG